MTDQLPAVLQPGALTSPSDTYIVPALIADAGDAAGWRYVEFFTANIRNPHTRRAYARACGRFFAWCEDRGLTITVIRSHDVATWVEELQEKHGAPGVKQQLAAVRMLFDWLITGQVVPTNPAAAVRGPKYVVTTGKTPVLNGSEWRKLLAAIPTETVRDQLPATADEWLATKGQELDRRLKRFVKRLQRGDLEGVEFDNERLHVTPVKATSTPEARAFADGIEAMMPRVRITELLHEVNRATGFASAFTNLRTGEQSDDNNALLAAILADATNLGLGRLAAASHGVTRDKLVWTADAYIRPETYKAALGKIIDAHHALPVANTWGDGTTSSSDRQFFRSGKRGDTAGDVNARYGNDPGLGFYTHVSDQHGPYNVRVMSATSHEAPYVLDGLMHHGTGLPIGTHYTDTGGASDHVFILCAMLGFRFCPRLRDFPDRKLACIEPITVYKDLLPILGRRIKADVIREHWEEILRLVASLRAGTVLPSAMLKRLAAYQRQNKLDLALQELGRIERTLFMLDWLESPQLRQLCQAGLNKSEQRHALAQVICTFKQGRIADRGQDAQQFRASGLNLVIAAIVYWNSTYLADAIDHMRTQGKAVPAELLAQTSPLSWEHIGFSGDFLWDRAAATAGRRRPLNLGRERMAA